MQRLGITESGMLGECDVPYASILNCLEDPVFVVDAQRRVLIQNTVARRLVHLGLGARVRDGVLNLPTPSDTALLENLLRECGGSLAVDEPAHCGGLRLPGENRGKDWLLLCTLAGSGEDGPIFIVQLVRRVGVRRLQLTTLQTLFNLTPRELNLVERLAGGASLQQIALALRLSRESSRIYLKRIFRKCDVHSQAELISLVQRLSLFTPEFGATIARAGSGQPW